MNFRNVTDTFLEVAKQYQADMLVAVNYIIDQHLYNKLHENGIRVDARDFAPMVTLMGINGDTQEERTADICKKIDVLTEAFSDPDHSMRKPYLDMIYDLVDSFDPVTVDMDDPEEVGRLLQCYLVDQTYGTQQNENPEYFKKRYPTPESLNMADARNSLRMAVASRLKTNMIAHHIVIQTGLTLPTTIPDELLHIHKCREDYERNRRDIVVGAAGNPEPSPSLDLPILDAIIPYAGKNVADIPKYPKNALDEMGGYFSLVVENGLLQAGSKNTQGLKEAGLTNLDALYVDGMPFNEFLNEHFPNDPNVYSNAAKIITTLMLNGRHKLDVVFSYRNEAGEMQHEAKTLRAAVTPEQEKLYMKQFSWFRRTFFNWGPFRIETLREKLDRIANDPNTVERHTKVVATQKDKIETKIARDKEEALRVKKTNEQNAALRAAFNKEASRLDESVDQWDKDSVIGILGQQLKGSYQAIRTGIVQSVIQDRYDKISVLFAKQVLYTHLCDKRAEKDKPGSVERSLMGDGTPESIRNNIETAATDLAKNAVFKNLFLSKVGDVSGKLIYPNLSKFEKMIVDGGRERFTQECMQNLKKTIKTKESQPEAAKIEIDAQKQETMVSTVK